MVSYAPMNTYYAKRCRLLTCQMTMKNNSQLIILSNIGIITLLSAETVFEQSNLKPA